MMIILKRICYMVVWSWEFHEYHNGKKKEHHITKGNSMVNRASVQYSMNNEKWSGGCNEY